jgi:uncharacterized membrane protein YcaP (DUF421 family)
MSLGHVSALGLASVAVRTLVVYVAVLALLRVSGKRELGQMSVFDLAVILLVANAVQNAMVGTDSSVAGGIVSAATLIAANFAVAFLSSQSERVARLFELPPAVIIRDGAIDRREMRRQFLTPGELESAMREHDIEDLSNVRLGTLEPNGSISFVKRSSGGG